MYNQEFDAAKTQAYRVTHELKNNKQLVLRVPQEADAQALIDYLKEVDSETRFLAREPGEFDFTLDQEETFIRNLTNDDSSQMFVGEVDGQIVANCSVGIVMSNRRYLHRATLGIAVRKAYWRMGIGKLLMQACITWCRNNGVEQLELEVVTQNERAIKMYTSLGFQVHGTKKHALKYSDGTYADEYFMILFLDETEVRFNNACT